MNEPDPKISKAAAVLGRMRSPRKADASRENGKRGGRPYAGGSRREAVRAYIREHGGLRGRSPAEREAILQAAMMHIAIMRH